MNELKCKAKIRFSFRFHGCPDSGITDIGINKERDT